jgi:hypothetical protein
MDIASVFHSQANKQSLLHCNSISHLVTFCHGTLFCAPTSHFQYGTNKYESTFHHCEDQLIFTVTVRGTESEPGGTGSPSSIYANKG